MKCLLIIAHGSRRRISNDEVRALAACIRTKVRDQFGTVECAFLELEEPSIPDAIRKCVKKGASEIVVMPYFLSAGRHVVEDIPREVALTRDQYPDVCIHIAPYLGSIDTIADLIVEQAGKSINKTER